MKTVLITGASSGIGLELAKYYALEGWRVIACGRSIERLSALTSHSTLIVPLIFDLTDKSQVVAAFSKLPFVPDLWIFNAGDCEYLDHGRIDSEIIERVMTVNVLGLSYALDAAQTHFVSGTHVAVVGSIASELALPRAGAYGASKAAVSYLIRSLALDWQKQGIDTSMIFPGFVKTPLTDKNDFAMPMMISAKQAAQHIASGLANRQSAIYFPARFTWILRALSLLPYRCQQWVISKSIRSPS